MRRVASTLVAIMLLVSGALSAQTTPPRVSVAPLTFSLGVLEGDVRALSALFETALVKSGAFTVVKQDEIQTILSAQETSLQDFADREYAVQLGKIVSASHVFVGTVARLGRAYVVSLQLVEVQTGRAVKAESEEALTAEAFAGMAKRLAELFAEKAAPAAAPATPRVSAPDAERVRMYTAIGDRFMELQRHDAALGQYEKARQIAEFDVDVLWRIVTARKQKLYSQTLYSSDAITTGLDVALRDDIDRFQLAPREQIDAILQDVYAIQAIQPLLQDDVSLLLDEAQILKVGGSFDDAATALRRAHRIDSTNPSVLAELGLLEALKTSDPGRARAGLDLIRQAIAKSPETALFQLYLARSLERVQGASGAESLRAYRRAAALAEAPDFWTRRVRDFAERSLTRAYYDIGGLPGGVLTDRLDLPLGERLEHTEYLVARGVPFATQAATRNPTFYLAALSQAAGKYGQAEAAARSGLPAEPGKWQAYHVPLLEILGEALSRTGADAALLSTVQARLKELRK